MFCTTLSSDSSCGKWRGKTEEEGFLEYKLPSSSEDSKEESFANKIDTTDIGVIGEIPSFNDDANFHLQVVSQFKRTIPFNYKFILTPVTTMRKSFWAKSEQNSIYLVA